MGKGRGEGWDRIWDGTGEGKGKEERRGKGGDGLQPPALPLLYTSIMRDKVGRRRRVAAGRTAGQDPPPDFKTWIRQWYQGHCILTSQISQ